LFQNNHIFAIFFDKTHFEKISFRNQQIIMLETSIEYLKGVGPVKAELLKKELSIFTYGQLLNYFPYRYIDRTKFHRILEISAESDYVQIKGILRKLDEQGSGPKRRLIGTFRDDSGVMELVWFKGLSWVANLQTGVEYVIFGKPSLFNGRVSMIHPDLELVSNANSEVQSMLEPVYSTTEKLNSKKIKSKDIGRIVKSLLLKIDENPVHLEENLPPSIREQFKFLSRKDSFNYIHFPQNQEQLKYARNRLKFEELFFLQLKLLRTKKLRKVANRGYVFQKIGDNFNNFYQNNLKFPLTEAQKRVIKEIRKDLGCGEQMNRLLQGDVGSGKTVVALMIMLIALDNGFQASLMAPTEILAQQHFKSISDMISGLGINIEILTGTVKGSKRKEILKRLESGEIHLLVGTHALIEDSVIFKRLGLTIIDEQHRFGVMQRAKMWKKTDINPPHILVMTATPIPRTLAMTVYGDLDVSVIDEMPPGRIPITTYHKYETQRLWVFGRMKEEIAKGHQIYIVYPLIEESESETMADIKDLMQGYDMLSAEFPKPQYQISVVHGKQKPADKEFEMQRFIKGETKIMIATTVIEVGVNVPNATLMVIENADRFGLAQLHQLRGRVGRGGGEAFCILMTGFKLSEESKFRMKTMCETTDGFRISEADLKLRGPGSIEGTQQSGIIGLKLADIVKDVNILNAAREVAMNIIETDPNLEKAENLPLNKFLQNNQTKQSFSRIS
jgi:ATP-dependent DNA helicase RecG